LTAPVEASPEKIVQETQVLVGEIDVEEEEEPEDSVPEGNATFTGL
jgi:hypothetical protein